MELGDYQNPSPEASLRSKRERNKKDSRREATVIEAMEKGRSVRVIDWKEVRRDDTMTQAPRGSEILFKSQSG